MGAAGLSRVERLFDPARMSNEVEGVYLKEAHEFPFRVDAHRARGRVGS